MTLLLALIGGAVGAPLRYLTDRAIAARLDPVFPWGTLTVNVTGSLLLGVVTGAAAALPGWAHPLLGVGLGGALSTYSTFGYETVRLLADSARAYAVANVLANVSASLAAAVAGLWLGAVLAG
ncbi:MAG: fluoride efflux transporter CrcB [Micromonosporaceae bacterium]|nr:fluoride efflux transporter CrcB [Micromonosporaceae bacterium]